MERALPAIILPREPRSRVTEAPAPRRAGWPRLVMSGAVCALMAAAAPGLVSSAQAECILMQPSQPAPDGTHWSLSIDRATNRRCWILVDAAGRDLLTPQPVPSTGLATLQSFLGNFTGGPPPPPPPLEPPASPVVAPRRPPPHAVQPRAVTMIRANRPARPEPKPDVRPVKHEMSPGDREALFEEFLRWHESQKITGAAR